MIVQSDDDHQILDQQIKCGDFVKDISIGKNARTTESFKSYTFNGLSSCQLSTWLLKKMEFEYRSVIILIMM